MKTCLKSLCILALLLIVPIEVVAQEGFGATDFAFFEDKKDAINEWLEYESLSNYLAFDSLVYDNDRLEIRFLPASLGENCNYLKMLWEGLSDKYYAEREEAIHIDMMSGLAFVMEVPKERLYLRLTCGDLDNYQVLISAERSVDDELMVGYEVVGNVEKMAVLGDPVKVKIGSLKPIFLVKLGNIELEFSARDKRVTVGKVSEGVEKFLKEYYKTKGTPILYRARPDVSRPYYNEFDISVSHLSHTVLKDEGFFEYHEFHVTVLQQADEIIVNWDFKGKYGSGILFAPRRSDYKEMKKKYAEEVAIFEKKIFAELNKYLTKFP